jgi:DNA-binding NtrC family response regulator
MSISDNCVLLSWVDLRTDPYGRGKNGERDKTQAGPTLTLLFDPESPYRGGVSDVVLFYRSPSEDPKRHEDFAAAEATRKEIKRLTGNKSIQVELMPWYSEDPTDHRSIFAFLESNIGDIGERFDGQPLVVHISPGTPAMQTVWVLMAEMGLIRKPFSAVKSLRRAHRAGRPAVVPVSLDIPTFYKSFHQARPRHVEWSGETMLLDPRHFVSSNLKRLYADARRFGQLNVPILILGERGTGKTTLASWIRSNSPFREPEKDMSWPSVPCSQYSPEIMRAELFGYVKGAFTDAKQDTEGLLHVADGDTLFLDEIGDISRDLQRMLIRALEEKRFIRVGAKTPEQSSFRLLSATNLPWTELKDRLDLDFLDRISVLVLEVPPLREVREDLAWLWRNIFQQALHRAGVAPEQINLEAAHHAHVVQHLSHHPLPGNLRDLFRVAYHLIAVAISEPAKANYEDIVTYALAKGLGHNHHEFETEDKAKSIAAAFSEDEPLDHMLGPSEILETRSLERSFRRYLAEEIRRIARVRGVKPQELCDVTDRTLQKWVKDEE